MFEIERVTTTIKEGERPERQRILLGRRSGSRVKRRSGETKNKYRMKKINPPGQGDCDREEHDTPEEVHELEAKPTTAQRSFGERCDTSRNLRIAESTCTKLRTRRVVYSMI